MFDSLEKLPLLLPGELAGFTYRGTYAPLVSLETWEGVQSILDGRKPNKSHPSKHQFTLSGLVHWGHCGCLMVGELKKGRYVYYHCTGNRGRCSDPYVREEQLLKELSGRLSDLVVAPETWRGWSRRCRNPTRPNRALASRG